MLEELLALAMLEDRRRNLDRLVLVLDARASIATGARRGALRTRLGARLRQPVQVASLPHDVRLEP